MHKHTRTRANALNHAHNDMRTHPRTKLFCIFFSSMRTDKYSIARWGQDVHQKLARSRVNAHTHNNTTHTHVCQSTGSVHWRCAGYANPLVSTHLTRNISFILPPTPMTKQQLEICCRNWFLRGSEYCAAAFASLKGMHRPTAFSFFYFDTGNLSGLC